METRRWTNPSLPQTLQIAVFLLYFRGVFNLLLGGFSVISVAIAVGLAAAGFGIANDKKWGYLLGVAMASLPIVLRLFYGVLLARPGILFGDPIGLMFEIALIALLLHPMSRDYQRIWFN